MLYLASNLQRKDNKMGINRYVLFVDTPLGSLEAETVQAKVLQGIKITLRDDGKEEPEIRVQYNPEKKAVEVLLFEAKRARTNSASYNKIRVVEKGWRKVRNRLFCLVYE